MLTKQNCIDILDKKRRLDLSVFAEKDSSIKQNHSKEFKELIYNEKFSLIYRYFQLNEEEKSEIISQEDFANLLASSVPFKMSNTAKVLSDNKKTCNEEPCDKKAGLKNKYKTHSELLLGILEKRIPDKGTFGYPESVKGACDSLVESVEYKEDILKDVSGNIDTYLKDLKDSKNIEEDLKLLNVLKFMDDSKSLENIIVGTIKDNLIEIKKLDEQRAQSDLKVVHFVDSMLVDTEAEKEKQPSLISDDLIAGAAETYKKMMSNTRAS